MDIDEALNLARNLKFGPLPNPNDPLPTLDEAIALIREERRTCGFNWMTGEAAVDVLKAHKREIENGGTDHDVE